MYTVLGVLFVLVCAINGRPQQGQQNASGYDQNTTPVAILNQTQEIQPDGGYRFSYDTANGINVQESAYIKHNENAARALPGSENETESGDILVIQGQVSYTAPDGQVINLRYIADENGYQPEGDHIPKLPGSENNQNAAVGQSNNFQQQNPQGQYQQQGNRPYQGGNLQNAGQQQYQGQQSTQLPYQGQQNQQYSGQQTQNQQQQYQSTAAVSQYQS